MKFIAAPVIYFGTGSRGMTRIARKYERYAGGFLKMAIEIPVTYWCWGCGSSVTVIEETDLPVPAREEWNLCPECLKRKKNEQNV